MTATAISVALVVAGLFVWERWDQHRGVDEEHAARQGEFGWRLIKLMAIAVAAITAGLVLQALEVPGAIIVVIVGPVALLLLIYVVPFFGPRKGRRPAAGRRIG